MSALTPEQRQRRRNVERLIRLAEPGLNLVLAIGDRVARIIQPEDHDYYPPRPSELASPERSREPSSGDRTGRPRTSGPPTSGEQASGQS